MRVSKTIKERLQSNVERREMLLATTLWRPLKRTESIEQEYLQLEAKTFEEMLSQTQTSLWDRMFSGIRILAQASANAIQKVQAHAQSQGPEQLPA